MHFGLNKSIRKLRPIDSVQYIPIPIPPVHDVPDMTEEESNSFNQKFVRMNIKNEIDKQAKMRRRAQPRIPRTKRELELASYKKS